MLQQGVAAHNAGNPKEAERLYRAILQVQPTHPDANHNLGLIAVSMNQSGVALPLFKNAIKVNPNIEQFWLSYIEALIAERQFENAKRALKKGKKKGVAKEKLKALTQKLVSVKAGNISDTSPVSGRDPETFKSLSKRTVWGCRKDGAINHSRISRASSWLEGSWCNIGANRQNV